MAPVQILLFVLLLSCCMSADASLRHSNGHHHHHHHQQHTHTSHEEDKHFRNSKPHNTSDYKFPSNSHDHQIISFDDLDLTNRTVMSLQDIYLKFDEGAAVKLSNLRLSIPSHLDLGNIDPDLSKMIIDIKSMIGSLEIMGDYDLFVSNIMGMPISSQGSIQLIFDNVTVDGEIPLALTPSALLALNLDFAYVPKIVKVQVVPRFKNIVTEEVRLSNEILNGPLFGLIKKEMESYLDYYMDTEISFLLSKISMFTIGHSNIKSGASEPFKQHIEIEGLFDELLEDAKNEILNNKKDKINIQNFNRNFSENLESQIINGSFSANEGWVAGLSSLERISNVTLNMKNNTFMLTAGIHFKHLFMGFENYLAKFLNTQVGGNLDGSFLHKTLTIKITMQPNEDGTCTTAMRELRVYRMNGYRIQNITNISSLEWLQRRINNWLVGYFQSRIADNVVDEVARAVVTSLSHFDCGEYLPHLKILT